MKYNIEIELSEEEIKIFLVANAYCENDEYEECYQYLEECYEESQPLFDKGLISSDNEAGGCWITDIGKEILKQIKNRD